MIKFFRVRRRTHQINKALNIKLYKWQIRYIFYNEGAPEEIRYKRTNGKTLAHILRILFGANNYDVQYNKASRTLNAYDPRTHEYFILSDNAVPHQMSYATWYTWWFMDIYHKLCDAGLKKYMNNVK